MNRLVGLGRDGGGLYHPVSNTLVRVIRIPFSMTRSHEASGLAPALEVSLENVKIKCHTPHALRLGELVVTGSPDAPRRQNQAPRRGGPRVCPSRLRRSDPVTR